MKKLNHLTLIVDNTDPDLHVCELCCEEILETDDVAMDKQHEVYAHLECHTWCLE